ncbi:kinase-like protein [Coprinopsis marcescibilis]|uniref:Kinase-like protein n=1 Tax=Coprinopsis marcescibilis TaxID=230819 RepID=A0A5C3KKM6_COPMA|nr:kinase-like protein [Coprinopsis marcescibilis]
MTRRPQIPARLHALRERLANSHLDVDNLDRLEGNLQRLIASQKADISEILVEFEGCIPDTICPYIEHCLFPRAVILVAACAETQTAISTLQQLSELQASQGHIPRLASYKLINNGLLDVMPYSLNNEAAENRILKLDAIHLVAQKMSALRGLSAQEFFSNRSTTCDQNLVDLLQAIIDFPGLGPVYPEILQALVKLCRTVTFFPERLFYSEVDITDNRPVSGGAFGDIYRERLALKCSFPQDKMLKNYCREGVIWSQFHHPNVLPFYGIFRWKYNEETDLISLLSPWMTSGNLQSYLASNPACDKMQLVLDIARGLEYIHNFRPPVVHGDLSVANVLITESGTACLADFGLGRLDCTSGSVSSNTYGREIYFAPELLEVEQSTDGAEYEVFPRKTTKTDVYAFACLCYEIYNGTARFSEYRAPGGANAIREGKSRIRPSALQSNLLWDLLQNLWDRDPSLRPTMSDFIARLKDTSTSGPVHCWKRRNVGADQSNSLPLSFAQSDPDTSSAFDISYAKNLAGTKREESHATLLNATFKATSTRATKKSMKWVRLRRPNDDVLTDDFHRSDFVVAIMGATGVGKSTFINHIAGKPVSEVGHALISCTQKVHHYAYIHHSGRRVVVADTPGFDDTYVDDSEIFRRIAVWLASAYSKDMQLGGVIYLYDISQRRLTGSARLNLSIFEKLCGPQVLDKVVIGTTKWNAKIQIQAAEREDELKRIFWATIIERKGKVMRVQNTAQSCHDVLDADTLRIQREIVTEEKLVPQTKAGKTLRFALAETLASKKQDLRNARDEETQAMLQEEVDFLTQQINGLNASFFQRIVYRFL